MCFYASERKDKISAYDNLCNKLEDAVTLCELAIEENDETMKIQEELDEEKYLEFLIQKAPFFISAALFTKTGKSPFRQNCPLGEIKNGKIDKSLMEFEGFLQKSLNIILSTMD